MSVSRPIRLAAVLLLAGALVGCAGTQPYVSSSESNLHIKTVADSGSWMSSVQTAVHIHSVDENCLTSYRGTLQLDDPMVTTGIPSGQRSYLVFSFDSSSFLANSRSSITYGTLLTPRPGRDYDVAVEYLDDTYNATIQEVDRETNQQREVIYRPLDACQA
jgi:hypothetical protein